MSTRTPATSSFGSDGNQSRRDQQNIERDPGGTITKSTGISFTSPGTIADSNSGLGWVIVNGWVEIRGSAANSRNYNVIAASSPSLTVVPPVVTTEAAGPLVVALLGF
jgi:hypothetical protein